MTTQVIQSTSPSSSGMTTSIKVAVVVIAGILAMAAIGLNTAVQAMGVYFKKEPVALRKPVTSLPNKLGPYLLISTDQPMESAQEHVLGTKDYFTRFYVDTRLLSPETMKALESDDKATRDRARLIAQNEGREGLIVFHTAYYTGMVDTVAHIPENCMVGGGFDPDKPKTIQLPVWDTPRDGSNLLQLKYIEFTQRDQADINQVSRYNVAYFFKVNGSYESDATTGVRKRLQNLTERFGYYCKIELKTLHGARTQVAQDRMADFLRYLMPEMEQILPDWAQVNADAKAKDMLKQ
jgi:hypothetical protein